MRVWLQLRGLGVGGRASSCTLGQGGRGWRGSGAAWGMSVALPVSGAGAVLEGRAGGRGAGSKPEAWAPGFTALRSFCDVRVTRRFLRGNPKRSIGSPSAPPAQACPRGLLVAQSPPGTWFCSWTGTLPRGLSGGRLGYCPVSTAAQPGGFAPSSRVEATVTLTSTGRLVPGARLSSPLSTSQRGSTCSAEPAHPCRPPRLPPEGCATLGKLLYLSAPQLLSLQNGNRSTHLGMKTKSCNV